MQYNFLKISFKLFTDGFCYYIWNLLRNKCFGNVIIEIILGVGFGCFLGFFWLFRFFSWGFLVHWFLTLVCLL